MSAVGTERKSKVVGWQIIEGNFDESSPNLPQRIGILGEANEANQASLDLTPLEIRSAQEAAKIYGYGSPIHIMALIFFPVSGGEGVGGIPVKVFPQAKAPGSTAKILEITPTGNATSNGTHTVIVGGRNGGAGGSYSVNISAGDTPEIICDKIVSILSNVAACPFIVVDEISKVTCTSKWRGLTANSLSIHIDTKGNNLGITYAITQTSAGSGTPSVTEALKKFGNEWTTIVINSYGTVSEIMDELEMFNGRPDPISPTGRFSGIIWKPFVAVTGSTEDNPSIYTDERANEVTIAIAPAPKSEGLPLEAAANVGLLLARQLQDYPHLDISGRTMPDMPTPKDIGSMAEYINRDAYVKKGCSTVELSGRRYVINDFVTTYHPENDAYPDFMYVRDLFIDMNIRYRVHVLEQLYLVDHVICNDNDVVDAERVVKPKQWKQQLYKLASDLAEDALIVDPEFTQSSIKCFINPNNPNRMQTEISYKRSGYGRICDTVVKAGFNLG
jgi:phage tail sheath gpL-like